MGEEEGMTIGGEIPVAFEVTRMSEDMYVVVLLHVYTYVQHVYREKKGRVYAGAEGSEEVHPNSLVAGLVQRAVTVAKKEELWYIRCM